MRGAQVEIIQMTSERLGCPERGRILVYARSTDLGAKKIDKTDGRAIRLGSARPGEEK